MPDIAILDMSLKIPNEALQLHFPELMRETTVYEINTTLGETIIPRDSGINAYQVCCEWVYLDLMNSW